MEIRVEGLVVHCEDAVVDWDDAAIIVTPCRSDEYKHVHVRLTGVGCDETVRLSVEELYAALCSAMAMRRQAQVSKANENRGWLPAPTRTPPYFGGGPWA